MLYVEGDNEAGPRLYDRLGFTVHQRRRGGYRRARPARSLSRWPRTLYDLTATSWPTLLDGEPRYRVDQVWDGPLRAAPVPPEMTDPAEGPAATAWPPSCPLRAHPGAESVSDGGDTVKWLWEPRRRGQRRDGAHALPRPLAPVCVSTQAGCAMACSFCATGQAGFERHLTRRRDRRAGRAGAPRVGDRPRRPATGVEHRVHGHGRAAGQLRRAPGRPSGGIHDDIGIGARHLTISTVGLVPGIRRLAAEDLPVNLAVSLHAADDELRDELVPINRRYPLDELMAACDDYLEPPPAAGQLRVGADRRGQRPLRRRRPSWPRSRDRCAPT